MSLNFIVHMSTYNCDWIYGYKKITITIIIIRVYATRHYQTLQTLQCYITNMLYCYVALQCYPTLQFRCVCYYLLPSKWWFTDAGWGSETELWEASDSPTGRPTIFLFSRMPLFSHSTGQITSGGTFTNVRGDLINNVSIFGHTKCTKREVFWSFNTHFSHGSCYIAIDEILASVEGATYHSWRFGTNCDPGTQQDVIAEFTDWKLDLHTTNHDIT